MNDLTTFTNPEFGQVRTVEIDGTPWLVGKDVAVALGYKNPGKAIIAHVDEEDKRLEMLPQEAEAQNGTLPSGSTKTALINESGLYSLILSSKMPKAKTDYGRICDSLRQAEGLVAKAQADLDSRIDQLSIIAFGLPGFDEIMNAVIGTVLPAEKKEE